MDHHPPACSTHRTLVTQALADDPSDAVLERYATEVAECAECRRALALHLGVHPAAIDRPDASGTAGMAALLQEMRAPPSRRRTTWMVAGATVAAMAALAGWLWVGALPAPPPAPASFPAPAPEVAVTSQGIAAPIPTVEVAGPPSLPADPVQDDAVALLLPDDWPPPAFEDLRGGSPKGVSARVRAAQLVLSGTSAVGHAMALTVVTSTPTALAVCVEGPERGVVWRGAVDAGRTELLRGGRPLAFAFAAPGRYRFFLSAGETELVSCPAPVHVVEVEVAG